MSEGDDLNLHTCLPCDRSTVRSLPAPEGSENAEPSEHNLHCHKHKNCRGMDGPCIHGNKPGTATNTFTDQYGLSRFAKLCKVGAVSSNRSVKQAPSLDFSNLPVLLLLQEGWQ